MKDAGEEKKGKREKLPDLRAGQLHLLPGRPLPAWKRKCSRFAALIRLLYSSRKMQPLNVNVLPT